MSVSRESLESTVSFLDVQGRQDWALGSLELLLGVVNSFPDLLFVNDAREKVLVHHDVKLLIRVVQHPKTVNMSEGDIVLTNILFKAIDDLLNGSPPSDVGSLEPNELLLGVKYITLLDDELRLVNIGATVAVLVHSVRLLICESLIIMIKVIIIFRSSGTNTACVRRIRVLLH